MSTEIAGEKMTSRLPIPGQDAGEWGYILNDFLSQSLNPDGTLQAIAESQVTNLTSDLALKVPSTRLVAGHDLSTDVTLTPSDIGAEPIGLSAPTQSALSSVNDSKYAPLAALLKGTPNAITAGAAAIGGVRNTVDGTGAAYTVTLPPPAFQGQPLLIERVDATTTNSITIQGVSGATIEGSASRTISMPPVGVAYESLLFVAESSTSWAITGAHKPKAWTDAIYQRGLGYAVATDPQWAGGIKWDGSDAAPAIQAALNSMKGVGGTVVIPAPPLSVSAGTYLQIGSTLTVWPRTRLVGASSLGSRLQAKAGIGGPVLRLTATDGSDTNWHWGQVRDLFIDGNKAAQTTPVAVQPIAVTPTGTSVSATINTSTSHGLLPGDPLLMSGFIPDIYNTVAFVFSVTDSTHFVVNLASQPATCTVIGTYRKLLVGISLSQAGETSEVANVQVQNCYDHGIVQGWIGTPMKYSSISLTSNGGDGLSLWTDRPVVVNGISGDGNATSLLGVHGKVSAGANAVGSVTVTGVKAENATSPALILDDYAQGVTVIGGGITLTSGNTTVPCMQRTAKSQVSSLNVFGVNCTPFWSGAGNIFQDLSSQASSVNTANVSGGTATFFIPSTNSVFAAGRGLSERVITVGDSANPTFNVTAAGIFELLCGSSVGSSRTIAVPTGAPVGQPRGQKITIRIQNSTGGAITTSWNAIFNLCGPWVDPVNGKSRVTSFYYNGTSWIEFGRGAYDQ